MTEDFKTEDAGFGLSPPLRAKPRNLIWNYVLTLKALLTAPTEFFRNLPRPVGMTGPLLFGIITSWIGSALEYLWYTGFGKVFGSRLSDIFSALDKTSEIDSSGQATQILAMREKILDWVFGVGAVLIDPFKTFLVILFLSCLVWVGARLFANLSQRDAEERLSFESAVSIVGYSYAASVFKVIPLLGGLIAGCFTAAIAIIGAGVTYRVGAGRAILIALWPSVLLWGIFLLGIIAFFTTIAFFLVR